MKSQDHHNYFIKIVYILIMKIIQYLWKNQILQEIEMELMGQRKDFGEAESSKSKDGTIP